jgi:hypothetical protein
MDLNARDELVCRFDDGEENAETSEGVMYRFPRVFSDTEQKVFHRLHLLSPRVLYRSRPTASPAEGKDQPEIYYVTLFYSRDYPGTLPHTLRRLKELSR